MHIKMQNNGNSQAVNGDVQLQNEQSHKRTKTTPAVVWMATKVKLPVARERQDQNEIQKLSR